MSGISPFVSGATAIAVELVPACGPAEDRLAGTSATPSGGTSPARDPTKEEGRRGFPTGIGRGSGGKRG